MPQDTLENLETMGDIRAGLNTMFAELYGDPEIPIVPSLLAGQSQTVTLFGDSTMMKDSNKRVPYRICEQIAAVDPLIRVEFFQWSDTNQRYGAMQVIQAGTAGERYMQFDGSGTAISRKIEANILVLPDPTDDLELELRFTPDSTSPGANMGLHCHSGGLGARGWQVVMQSNGDIVLTWWSDSSSDASAKTFTVTAAQLALSTSAVNHIRLRLDVDNGASGYTATAEKSTNAGSSWTEIASETVSGTTSIAQPASTYCEIGARQSTNSPFAGKIYRAWWRKGFDGPLCMPSSLDAYGTMISGNTVANSSGGAPTLRWFNGSAVGKNLSYHTDLTRFPKLLAPQSSGLVVINDGHNAGSTVGAAYSALLDSFYDQIIAQAPAAQIAMLTQNPEVASRIGVAADAQNFRQRAAAGWAMRKGVTLIDAYAEIGMDPRGIDALVAMDGVHAVEPDGYMVMCQPFCRRLGVAYPTA